MSFQSPMPLVPLQDEKLVVAAVYPVRFEIRYKQLGDGTMRAEEWVEWAKKGVSIPFTVVQKVSRIQKAAARPGVEADDEAAALWRALKPFYENWKAGGDAEMLTTGTPLSIWPAVTRDVVEALKAFKIYSVEDLSIAADAVLQRIADPNIMRYRDRAKKFLSTKDIAEAVRDMDNKDAQLAELKAQVEMLQKAHADSDKKRREAEDAEDAATPAPARKRRAGVGAAA